MKREDKEHTIAVYDAPNDQAGRMVVAFLEQKGISAFFKDPKGPAFDGVEAIWSGHEGGMVFVLSDDESRARELLGDYLASIETADDDNAEAEPSA